MALLTMGELVDFRDQLVGRMKHASVNRACKPLKAALSLAAKRDKRIANRDAWREGLEAFPDTATQEADPVTLTDDEVRALIAAAYAIDGALGLLVELLAGTGVRISQAARLTARDVEGDRLNMPRSKKGKGVKRIDRKRVPITAELAAKLRLAAAGRDRAAALLVRSDGTLWNKDNIQVPFAAAVAKAGLGADVTSYALRHSSITQMLVRRVAIRLVADLHDTSRCNDRADLQQGNHRARREGSAGRPAGLIPGGWWKSRIAAWGVLISSRTAGTRE